MRKFVMCAGAAVVAFSLAGCKEEKKPQTPKEDAVVSVQAPKVEQKAEKKTRITEVRKRYQAKPGYFIGFSFNNLASEKHNGVYSGAVQAYCPKLKDYDLDEYKQKCREDAINDLKIKDRVYPYRLGEVVATDNPEIRPHALTSEAEMRRAVTEIMGYNLVLVKELKFTPNN